MSHCLTENAVFGKDDPKAVELPIAIDPNNEDSVIDRVCYFVYGKFLLTYFYLIMFLDLFSTFQMMSCLNTLTLQKSQGKILQQKCL